MSTVVVIRAGVTDYDEDHRLLGTLDVPLNDRGRQQISEVVHLLEDRGIRPEIILCSSGNPASETAKLVAEANPSARLKNVNSFRNVDQGLWQGLREEEVRRRFPRVFRSGRDDPSRICAPEGESLQEALRRVESDLDRAIRKYDCIIVVIAEPLATATLCSLQKRRVGISECLCGDESNELIQVVEVEEFSLPSMDPENYPDGGVLVTAADKGTET